MCVAFCTTNSWLTCFFPKDPLFLRELIDNSPSEESSRELEDVAGRIGAVVTHINEQRRLKQGLEGVVQIFQQLATDYPLIKAQRVLVFKGSGPLKQLMAPPSSRSNRDAISSPRIGSPREEAMSPRTADGASPDAATPSALSFLKRVSRRGSAPSVATRRVSTSGSNTLIDVLPSQTQEAHVFLFNDLVRAILFIFRRSSSKRTTLT